jgi:hypothetical protein
MTIYQQVSGTGVAGDGGAAANTGTGDTARAAYIKINDNFTLLETLPINAQVGTTYGPLLTDANSMITMDNAAANTITIPANGSIAFPVGTRLHFMQLGAGITTIAITGDTLNGPVVAPFTIREQFVPVTALKQTTTTWLLYGNLTGA